MWTFLTNPDPKEREKQVRERADRAGQIARRFPNSLFYELGNEPDLDFFYRGTIDEYIAGMVMVRDAIKAANSKAVVMNGGLSFAGEMGDRRSREFCRKSHGINWIAVAYHGHGPLAEAERTAHDRATRAARQFGKTGKPFIETESGVAARTNEQEQVQARTAVEKLVYGQSTGMPYFLWFRLLMFEEDYGNLRSEQEPRPAVLTYRNTVEQLRGLRFTRLVPTGREDVEAYEFGAKGTAKRVIVLWNRHKDTVAEVSLTLAKSAANVQNLRLIDMFGNIVLGMENETRLNKQNRQYREYMFFGTLDSLTQTTTGDVLVSVSENPVFLEWNTKEPAFPVGRAAQRIQTPSNAALIGNTPGDLRVILRNPAAKPLSAMLETTGGSGITALPTKISVNLPAKGVKSVVLKVASQESQTGILWPRSWRVFFDVGAEFRPKELSALPDTLPGASGYKTASPDENGLMDFVKMEATVKERAQAVAVAEIESDREQTVKIGLSADWWLACFVNGKPIYDTLSRGNGAGFQITDHIIFLPLKKGKNLVVIEVLSGSQGWKLLVGDPAQVEHALFPGKRSMRIRLSLHDAKGGLIARESVGVQQVTPLPPLPIPLVSSLSRWEQFSPDISLQDNIVNLFDKEPDSSRWWKGADDFSAKAWLRADDKTFYVVVAVRDDKSVTEPTGNQPARKPDMVRIGLSRSGTDYDEYEISGGVIHKTHREGGSEIGILFRQDAEAADFSTATSGVTLYRLAFDRKRIGDGVFFFNLLVNDNDGYGRKQYAAWKPGIEGRREPFRWQQVILPVRENKTL